MVIRTRRDNSDTNGDGLKQLSTTASGVQITELTHEGVHFVGLGKGLSVYCKPGLWIIIPEKMPN